MDVKHRVSGVICTVTPEKAERLGWERVADVETSEDADQSEKKPAPRQRGARK